MFNRICTASLALMLILPLAALGQTAASSSSLDPLASVGREDLQKDVAIRILRQRVESVDWNEFTLENIFDWLKEQGPINVIPNWYAMEAAGVNRDSLVTLTLRETTVGEVLKEAIEQVSEERVVRYQAFKNTIRISTKDDFERSEMHIRVYDATDILFNVPDFWGAPEIDLTQAQQGGGQGGSQTGRPVFQDAGGDDQQRGAGDEELRQRMEELRTLIEIVIEPEHWDTNGGPGAIVPYNRVLVINASPEVHEKIAGVFAFGR